MVQKALGTFLKHAAFCVDIYRLREVQVSTMFTQARTRALILSAPLLLGLIAVAVPARAELITGSRYTAAYSSYDSFFWFYRYNMDFNGTTALAQVQIEFAFDSSVQKSDTEKASWKADMESAIEGKWNNQHSFEYDGVTITSAVDVAYDRPFNQTVRVMPGTGPTTMTTWYWDQIDMASAHEFGHMIGLYDEYWGGALSPDHFLDYSALMGSTSGTPAMPDRYYQPFVDFVVSLQVPEPTTTSMIISAALTGLALLRRKSKQRLSQRA